jgi:Ca2+-binding RTX toxin-like protein
VQNIPLNPGTLNVTGGNDSDTFVANSGSKGNFTIDGAGGTDTVDYSQLGQTVTLAANGVVNKGGGLGSDTVKNVEGFIGANNQINTIDGTTTGGPVSFNIDLSKNNLTLENSPSFGSISFNVAGFSKVIGTNNNDIIKGGAGDDIFVGSKGNDTYDGAGGSNTLDYSKLGTGITLGANGSIDKGALGKDTTIGNINKYIGAEGQTNTIDGTTTGGAGSFDIDLSQNSLKLNGLGIGPLALEATNFSNVVGTNNNDKIVGNAGDNKLTGGKGNDTLTGGNGKDLLNGTNNTARGVGEVDTLTGGGGADTFVLGDNNGSFYLGNGKNDYALINDFDFTQDRIRLGGNKDLLSVKFDRKSGTVDLFSKQNGGKDLVAKVKLANPFNVSSKSEMMGVGTAKTAMAASSVMDGETSLSPAAIGGDMASIEGMLANSIIA